MRTTRWPRLAGALPALLVAPLLVLGVLTGPASAAPGAHATPTGAAQPQVVVGRARHIGNDYPWETIGQFEHQGQGLDPWQEYDGQCDSFAAWKAYENLNGSGPAPRPAIVPAPGWSPGNASISNVDQNTWGNAGDWLVSAPRHGWSVDNVPTPGSIAIWGNGNLGSVGHVGYVDDVYADGSITIENYNLHVNGEYSKFTMPYGGGQETSFGQTYQLPWPNGFAHVGDGAARDSSGRVLAPEPALTGTEYGYQYSPNVHLAGPGSPSSVFGVTGTWKTGAGHGELGNMKYASTSATATATATWAPAGLLANTCYRVDTLVPDEFSNNPAATYRITSATGTASAAVDENRFTNDWAPLGSYRTSAAGGITVMLNNTGGGSEFVAADALRFWQQTSC